MIGQIAQGHADLFRCCPRRYKACADYLIKKITELRIFEDAQGKMNVSAQEAGAQFLVVSQFTLYGNCDKGRRPSFDQAADPVKGEELYNYFVSN